MLTFFPTPYPGEWWYSVLSRFYVRTGIHSQDRVNKMLYGNISINHGQLASINGIRNVLEILPPGFLGEREVILKHTLMPFYFRLKTLEEKNRILSNCENGIGYQSKRVEKNGFGFNAPRYCPKCYTEDIEQYGEPFWHREHQVPLCKACSIHRCKLVEAEVNWSSRFHRFLPLVEIRPTANANPALPWECKVAEVIKEYTELPYQEGPSRDYDNLTWLLLSKGYGAPKAVRKGGLNTVAMKRDCKALFGESITNLYFDQQAKLHTFYRTVTFAFRTPERYILLQVLSGGETSEIFGENLCEKSGLTGKLREKYLSKRQYHTNELIKELNINRGQLEMLAEYCYTPKFWGDHISRGPQIRKSQLNLMLTEEEKECVRQVAKKAGKQMSVLAREVLMDEIYKLK